MNANLYPIAVWLGLLGLMPQAGRPPRAVEVSLVRNAADTGAIRHGWDKLEAALTTKGIRYDEVTSIQTADAPTVIVGGLPSSSDSVSSVLRWFHLQVPASPESLVIHKGTLKGKTVLLLTGADERGTMYSLLQAAERIGWAANATSSLQYVQDSIESPMVRDRGVTIFTMQQAQFENRLHNADYWTKYLDMLSQDRFNRLQILFAYETDGYMCPAYPYFVNVKGFPNVRVVGLTPEQQAQNRADLHRLIHMARDRGIGVTLGLWCHFYRYTRTFQPIDPSKQVKSKVFGLSQTKLIPYTRAALGTFLREFSDIDSVQFLMNGETGTKASDLNTFWRAICQTLKEAAPNLQYEVRAKGVSDDMIAYSKSLGLKVRLNTKFWAEQVGLPFPPTHVQQVNQFERRHGYSDMLKYPRPYELHWTLWTAGTTRILLWGDPNYARRFARSTLFEGTHGFEVDEPLATKMAGFPHDMQPFQLLNAPYRYYDYEFQRYWHFFQVFGRLAYNPNTPSEEWDHEFRRRFGSAAPYVEQGIHRASQILPHITAYCLPANRFPTTRGWAERQREEDLPKYAMATPSDTEQFESLQDAARDIIAGTHSAKITPLQTSQWFAQASDSVLKLAREAEEHAGTKPNRELVSTLVDLRILANLAAYHSRRIPAGLSYALFQQTHDLNALNDAIAQEKSAIAAWEGIVRAAGDVYNFDLKMGLPEFDMSGHWRDEIPRLQHGLQALEAERAAYHPEAARVVGRYDLGAERPLPGYERVSAEGTSTGFERAGSNVMVIHVPDGRYLLDVGIRDDKKSHGPMWIEANGVEYTDSFTVPAGQEVHKVLETSSVNGRLKVVFDSSTSADWHASTLTVTRVDPLILHVPVRRLAPGHNLEVRATVEGVAPITSVRICYGNNHRGYRWKDLQSEGDMLYHTTIPASEAAGLSYFLQATDKDGRIGTFRENGVEKDIDVSTTSDTQPPVLQETRVRTAEPGRPLRIVARVSDPSGVAWVHLRYRGVSQHQDFKLLNMLPVGNGDLYEATIPGKDIDPHYDLMYLFETMDRAGNGKIYPDLERETPYVVVKVDHASDTAQAGANIGSPGGK